MRKLTPRHSDDPSVAEFQYGHGDDIVTASVWVTGAVELIGEQGDCVVMPAELARKVALTVMRMNRELRPTMWLLVAGITIGSALGIAVMHWIVTHSPAWRVVG